MTAGAMKAANTAVARMAGAMAARDTRTAKRRAIGEARDAGRRNRKPRIGGAFFVSALRAGLSSRPGQRARGEHR
jgi:hypothetical protein